MAQTAAGAKDGAPSEAARRAAESPYRFILQNATIRERPKRAPEPAPEKETARRPAAPEQAVAAVPARPAPQPAPASTLVREPEPVTAPAAPAAPATTPVAAAVPQAAPPPPAVRKALVAIKQDAPELGPLLKRERPTGVVTVSFDVNPDGSVADVKVVQSTNAKLNRASVAAIQGWKFAPIDETREVEIELSFSN